MYLHCSYIYIFISNCFIALLGGLLLQLHLLEKKKRIYTLTYIYRKHVDVDKHQSICIGVYAQLIYEKFFYNLTHLSLNTMLKHKR